MKYIKNLLKYLLNKTGYFIILDIGEMSGNKDWTHYSMNVSFWDKRKTLDNLYINGEVADTKELGVWSKRLDAKEVATLNNICKKHYNNN